MLIKWAEKWLELHSSPEPLHLNSPSVLWERALIWGHPTHPVCSLRSLVSVSVLNRPPVSQTVLCKGRPSSS